MILCLKKLICFSQLPAYILEFQATEACLEMILGMTGQSDIHASLVLDLRATNF